MPVAGDSQENPVVVGNLSIWIIFSSVFHAPAVVLTRAVLTRWLPDSTQYKQNDAIFVVRMTKTANVTSFIFFSRLDRFLTRKQFAKEAEVDEEVHIEENFETTTTKCTE